jgi:hypothetical protein
MLKRRSIGKWLILIISVSVFLCAFANADDSELSESEPYEISDSVKEFENDPSFIAYRGTIPETIDQDWKNSITDCWLNLNKIGPSYSEFDISISGVAASDVIIIELGSAYKGEVDDSRIDEMYQKIEDYCEKQGGMSDIPVVFMWAQDEEDLPLPDYGPQIFEEAKKNPLCVATRGKMPVITDASEKEEWTDSLVQCSRSLANPSNADTGIQTYFASSGGPVSTFGTNINGYFKVGLEGYSSEKVNESIIDEIYQVIDEQCEKEGISDVPVVFEFVGYLTVEDDILPEDEIPNVSESDDASLSDNEEENDTKIGNQMPGFTSIIAILGFFSIMVFKRS